MSFEMIQLDLSEQPPPRAFDLVISRHVLMHLSNAEIVAAARGVHRSGSSCWLATNSYICGCNGENAERRDLAIARDLTSAPFSFPAAAIDEQHADADGPLVLWSLARLRIPRTIPDVLPPCTAHETAARENVCQVCGCSAALGGGVLPVPLGAIACGEVDVQSCQIVPASMRRGRQLLWRWLRRRRGAVHGPATVKPLQPSHSRPPPPPVDKDAEEPQFDAFGCPTNRGSHSCDV